jgi:ADP-ribose pyrophosphatase YjhB (NUDIX family)
LLEGIGNKTAWGKSPSQVNLAEETIGAINLLFSLANHFDIDMTQAYRYHFGGPEEWRANIRSQCVIHKENRLLMAQHQQDGKTWWCLPGGGVEEGETPEEAVLRELQEECSVTGRIIREINHATYISGEEAYTYLVDIGEQIPRLGTDPEFPKTGQVLVDIAWLTLAEIPERDRTFLWDSGLLRIPVFLAEVSEWGDDLSYPG